MTLYIMPGFEQYNDLLSKLGSYKTGKSCLHQQAGRWDLDSMRELVAQSADYMAAQSEE